MENITTIVAAVTAVILFVFGLEHFSREVERVSGENFRKNLSRATRLPVVGFLIGALVTALIQSSSATSVITISLVNAGVLSFKNSIGVILGTNVGTTVTAQLVAFKATAFAPLIIIFGFALSIMRNRWSIFGKSIFYFGFVFFSLNLISSALAPLQQNEDVVRMLTDPHPMLLTIFFGMAFTALVQSSSVTTGLAIIFTQQGILSLENAVPLIMGANIGTTVTAFIASLTMDVAAKKTAFCHFLFNVGGVALFAPLVWLFGDELSQVDAAPAIVLANVHLVFNVGTSVVFLLLINHLERFINSFLGEGKMEFDRVELPVYDAEQSFEACRETLQKGSGDLLKLLEENYSEVTLSLETNYPHITEVSRKRLEYMDFVKKEYLTYFSRVASNVSDQQESEALIDMVQQYDYLFQIHDSITDLFETKQLVSDQYLELESDILMMIRRVTAETLGYMTEISKARRQDPEAEVSAAAGALQKELNRVRRELLKLLTDPNRKDAGVLANIVTYSQRLKDKLENYYRSCA